MEKRALDGTTFSISKIGLGGFHLPSLPNSDAIDLVRFAYENDINFFETARDYRNSEETIGIALRDVRDDVVLASKMGARMPRNFDKTLSLSLKKMGTDYLDIYTMQGVNSLRSYKRYAERILPLMEREKEVGRIKNIGLSSHSIDVITEASKNPLIDVYFTPMNIMLREPIRVLLPTFHKLNKGIVAIKAFGGYKYNYMQGQDPKWIKNTSEFDRWFAPEIALSYLLTFPRINSILCGFTTKEQIQLDCDIVNGKINISNEDYNIFKFDALWQECSQCGKCKCEQTIRIPFLMRIWEYYNFYGIKEWTRECYNHLDVDWRDCTLCGKCNCPKGLNIPLILDILECELRNDR